MSDDRYVPYEEADDGDLEVNSLDDHRHHDGVRRQNAHNSKFQLNFSTVLQPDSSSATNNSTNPSAVPFLPSTAAATTAATTTIAPAPSMISNSATSTVHVPSSSSISKSGSAWTSKNPEPIPFHALNNGVAISSSSSSFSASATPNANEDWQQQRSLSPNQNPTHSESTHLLPQGPASSSVNNNAPGYQSLGGDGYTSPRGASHPTTDYVGGSHSTRGSKKLLYLVLVSILFAGVGAVVFFFVPRQVDIQQTSFSASLQIVNTTAKHGVQLSIQDIFLVSNPNYASLVLGTVTLNVVFVAALPNASPAASISLPTTVSLHHRSNSPFFRLAVFETDADRTFQPRTFNGDFSLTQVLWAPMTPTQFATFSSLYTESCSANNYYFIQLGGSASVSFLSVDSDVTIDPITQRTPCV